MPLLADRGVEIDLVALRGAPDERTRWLEERGVQPTILHARSVPQGVRRLRRYLRDRRPDVLHTALFASDTVGRLAAIATGIPVVTSLVSTPYSPFRRSNPALTPWKLDMVRFFERRMAGRTERFHAVSQGVAEHAVRELGIDPVKVTVAERGRSQERFGTITPGQRAALRGEMGGVDGVQLVLAVGRIEYPKAFDTLVDAVSRLPEHVRLAIVGHPRSHPDVRALKAMIDTTGMHDRVLLLGERQDIPQLMASADVLCVSSRYEGTSGVALEAMAAGLAIVATDVEGLRGILIDGDNAVTAAVESSGDLASALRRVLDDRDLAAALAGRARRDFDRRFTAEHAADRMAALYRNVANSG